ncbi:MAG: single-stranded-DNA-specific exonuclease RecJ, partial [Firmicutes bacterium]|nr:single-stranded-DNA-specific exonuclease RecJ [Candidatus Colimorpha enterica]
MKPKKWVIGERQGTEEEIKALSEQLNISEVTAQLLYNRGYTTPASAFSFISLDSERFHNPFRLDGMIAATDRILTAIKNKEKIAIYGDYDVDGITSVCVMYLYLKSIGADISYYIPDRASGYGVNKAALDGLISEGTELIVTVDTGITAIDEIAYAEEKGCDVVVTDHHECRDVLPQCVAAINPRRQDSKYPLDELAGVGVALKLITALEFSLRKSLGEPTEGFINDICDSYIDLVAIGTIADVMPLTDENRLIVRLGLAKMNRKKRPGIEALIEKFDKNAIKKPVNTQFIGYNIAPRLNAAGRMDSASVSVGLLLSDSKSEALSIAGFLNEANVRRREEENSIVSDIDDMIVHDPSLAEKNVIVLSSDSWHQGVIGVAASKVAEKYSKPTILITFDGDTGKGSGRSVEGFNLADALAYCADMLTNYGGHELAAGIKIERDMLDAFVSKINSYAAVNTERSVPCVTADFELKSDEISLRTASELSLLEPYGFGNAVPQFAARNLTVDSVTSLSNNAHTKLQLKHGKKNVTAMCFGMNHIDLGFVGGDGVDIIFNLSVNDFMGRQSEQVIVREILPSHDTLLCAVEEN